MSGFEQVSSISLSFNAFWVVFQSVGKQSEKSRVVVFIRMDKAFFFRVFYFKRMKNHFCLTLFSAVTLEE